MNYAELVQVEDEQILIFELMQYGLLSRTKSCNNVRKHNHQVQMEYEEIAKRWRCKECSNTISVLADSFFHRSHTPLLTWIQVIKLWCQETTIAAIAAQTLQTELVTGDHVKHLREQCQAYLVRHPPIIGGPGTHVKVSTLKKCQKNANHDILIITQPNKRTGYLLHNKDDRYSNANRAWILPIAQGSMVFSETNFNIQPNIAVSNTVDLYQGDNNLAEQHAIRWIRQKKGIRCNKAGGYLAEYNLRYFDEMAENSFGDCFLQALVANYANEL